MDKLDIFEISVNQGNLRNQAALVRKGQKVVITRMVTFTYELDVVYISELLDEMDETDISVEDLIQYEKDNNPISDILDEADETDDEIITVEIG